MEKSLRLGWLGGCLGFAEVFQYVYNFNVFGGEWRIYKYSLLKLAVRVSFVFLF